MPYIFLGQKGKLKSTLHPVNMVFPFLAFSFNLDLFRGDGLQNHKRSLSTSDRPEYELLHCGPMSFIWSKYTYKVAYQIRSYTDHVNPSMHCYKAVGYHMEAIWDMVWWYLAKVIWLPLYLLLPRLVLYVSTVITGKSIQFDKSSLLPLPWRNVLTQCFDCDQLWLAKRLSARVKL